MKRNDYNVTAYKISPHDIRVVGILESSQDDETVSFMLHAEGYAVDIEHVAAYLCVAVFDSAVVEGLTVDKAFFARLQKFSGKKNVTFIGNEKTFPLKRGEHIMYSGGKESFITSCLRPHAKKLALMNIPVTGADEYIVSNVEDLLFQYCSDGKWQRIEWFFPLCFPCENLYVGIEKDAFVRDLLGYDYKRFQKFLSEYGVHYKSIVKDMYSWEIVAGIPFGTLPKCNGVSSGYCYTANCSKCDMAYLFNFPNFDVEQWKASRKRYYAVDTKRNFIRSAFTKSYAQKLIKLLEKYESVHRFPTAV